MMTTPIDFFEESEPPRFIRGQALPYPDLQRVWTRVQLTDFAGLEQDFAGLPKKNRDGWENAFNMAFNQMIGAEYRQYVHLRFETIAEKTLCAVSVQPASAPAYLTFKGKEEFYIRTGNSTQPLTVSKATTYIQMHFEM